MKHLDHEDREENRLDGLHGACRQPRIKSYEHFLVVVVVFVFQSLVVFAAAPAAFGQATEVARPDAVTEARLKALAEELRCLVCQNQTIADSNAPLAVDLRGQIRGQIAAGRSDSQIRDYMVERYGDFVLYRPPFKALTVLLWVGPFALLAFGAVVLVRLVRRRKVEATAPLAPERKREIEKLLDG